MDAEGRAADRTHLHRRIADWCGRVRRRETHRHRPRPDGDRHAAYHDQGAKTRPGGNHDDDARPEPINVVRNLPHDRHPLPRLRRAVVAVRGSDRRDGRVQAGRRVDAPDLALRRRPQRHRPRLPLPQAGRHAVDYRSRRQGRSIGRRVQNLPHRPRTRNGLRTGRLFGRGRVPGRDRDHRTRDPADQRRLRRVVHREGHRLPGPDAGCSLLGHRQHGGGRGQYHTDQQSDRHPARQHRPVRRAAGIQTGRHRGHR